MDTYLFIVPNKEIYVNRPDIVDNKNTVINFIIFILNKCKQLKEAYEQAVWSDKEPDTRLDDGTSDIDSLDSSEYASFPFYDKLMTNIQGR